MCFNWENVHIENNFYHFSVIAGWFTCPMQTVSSTKQICFATSEKHVILLTYLFSLINYLNTDYTTENVHCHHYTAHPHIHIQSYEYFGLLIAGSAVSQDSDPQCAYDCSNATDYL